VVFPPVDTTLIHINVVKDEKYYLIVNRLVPYKRVDLAISSFNKLGLPLVVIGKGSEESRLKSMANKNIKFVGEVSEKELSKYYQNAKALIMPQEEDFGIVAVEAQSFGVPVIAYKKGGALDTVIDGKTGILFKNQNVESLMQAVKKFDRMSFNERVLKENAKRFSFDVFKEKILNQI
jgi:glycosyltransferase involved in cell wall biosynthesis